MPIYMIIALDIIIIIRSSINCPTIIVYPPCAFFSGEATSEIYGPEVYRLSYLLFDLSFAVFVYKFIIPKNQKITFCTIYFLILFCVLFISIYPNSYKFIYLFTKEGITNPLTWRVASICSLCAGTIYIVLLCTPSRLIP